MYRTVVEKHQAIMSAHGFTDDQARLICEFVADMFATQSQLRRVGCPRRDLATRRKITNLSQYIRYALKSIEEIEATFPPSLQRDKNIRLLQEKIKRLAADYKATTGYEYRWNRATKPDDKRFRGYQMPPRQRLLSEGNIKRDGNSKTAMKRMLANGLRERSAGATASPMAPLEQPIVDPNVSVGDWLKHWLKPAEAEVDERDGIVEGMSDLR